MTKVFLAAGVAALAIAVPAVAKPDKQGGGKGQAAQVQKAPKAGGGGNARATKQDRAAKQQRGQQAMKQDRRDKRSAQAARPEKAQGVARAKEQRKALARADKAQRKAVEKRSDMAAKAIERRDRQLERVAERRGVAERPITRDWDRNWERALAGNNWVDGCPPGLAKKPVACMPPGLAKQLVGQRVDTLKQYANIRELPDRLRMIYPDTDDYYYRFANGYAYRVDRETQLINALLPLFGLGVTVGQPFPTAFNTSNYYLPSGLQPFYQSSPYDQRYANGYVYEIDPLTGLVVDVDPMLGYGYGYGQMMPATFSAYNVPYQYRPLYADTPNQYYRYAPGAIYQVDPTTSLITGVAALLTGGMTVGQPLPTGYDVYNVPMAYRDQYYDRPDAWYRYSNGYVYQVDPTTRLVTAIVQALT